MMEGAKITTAQIERAAEAICRSFFMIGEDEWPNISGCELSDADDFREAARDAFVAVGFTVEDIG